MENNVLGRFGQAIFIVFTLGCLAWTQRSLANDSTFMGSPIFLPEKWVNLPDERYAFFAVPADMGKSSLQGISLSKYEKSKKLLNSLKNIAQIENGPHLSHFKKISEYKKTKISQDWIVTDSEVWLLQISGREEELETTRSQLLSQIKWTATHGSP